MHGAYSVKITFYLTESKFGFGKTDRRMLLRQIRPIYCENCTKQNNYTAWRNALQKEVYLLATGL